MDSTVTNSISFGNVESPRSDLSSFFHDSPIRWKRTLDKSISREQEEFGQLEDLDATEPLVIKFSSIHSGERGPNGQSKMEIACQLDDFIEVPILDAEDCLESLTEDRISRDSVEIEVNVCSPKCKIAVENVLRKLLSRRERCREARPVKRLSFFIYDFTYAKDLAPILARIAPNTLEFNLGIAKRKTYPLQPVQEAKYVLEFLRIFIQHKNTWETLRVLRVFYFVGLDNHLEKCLNKCTQLRHLTISNIEDIGLFELDSVDSVLLDSCDYSISLVDDMFADKHPRLFPNANTFGFLRCPISLAIRALNKWSSDRVEDKRKELFFYQPERTFRRFLLEATKSFEMVVDEKELEGEVQIKGHMGGPLITVFNKDRVYKARVFSQ